MTGIAGGIGLRGPGIGGRVRSTRRASTICRFLRWSKRCDSLEQQVEAVLARNPTSEQLAHPPLPTTPLAPGRESG